MNIDNIELGLGLKCTYDYKNLFKKPKAMWGIVYFRKKYPWIWSI